jgi:hypothetical protein
MHIIIHHFLSLFSKTKIRKDIMIIKYLKLRHLYTSSRIAIKLNFNQMFRSRLQIFNVL